MNQLVQTSLNLLLRYKTKSTTYILTTHSNTKRSNPHFVEQALMLDECSAAVHDAVIPPGKHLVAVRVESVLIRHNRLAQASRRPVCFYCVCISFAISMHFTVCFYKLVLLNCVKTQKLKIK